MKTFHPAVCTECCKRVATGRGESPKDIFSDLLYSWVAMMELAMGYLVFPVGALVGLPLLLLQKPHLGPKRQARLNEIMLVMRDCVDIEKQAEFQIAVLHYDLEQVQRRTAITYKERDFARQQGLPIHPFEMELQDLALIDRDLRNRICEFDQIVSAARADHARLNKERIATQYPKIRSDDD